MPSLVLDQQFSKVLEMVLKITVEPKELCFVGYISIFTTLEVKDIILVFFIFKK